MKIEDFKEWQPIVDKIRKVSNATRLDTYIVGGFVRDLLLGRSPKDLDLMVAGRGKDGGVVLAKALEAAYGGKAVEDAAASFPVAKYTLDGHDLDFAVPRTEIYVGSRTPEIKLATPPEDAKRRDFTVNAIFIRLSDGEVLDYTGRGIDDLKNKILRVANPQSPDTTMQDDPLRMLRLVRQASQLGFSVDKEAMRATARNAQWLAGGITPEGRKIEPISKERVQEELNKILLTETPSVAFKLMKKTDLLKYISPELDALEKAEEEEGHGSKNVWAHTLQVIDQAPKDKITRLAALFHDVAKPETLSRTYVVTCSNGECGRKGTYVFHQQPEIGYVCENCGTKMVFKDQKALAKAFPGARIHFYNHDKIGSEIAQKVLSELKYSNDEIKMVSGLVLHHMRPHAYKEYGLSQGSLNQLLSHVADAIDGYNLPDSQEIIAQVAGLIKAGLAKETILTERSATVIIKEIGALLVERTINTDADNLPEQVTKTIMQALIDETGWTDSGIRRLKLETSTFFDRLLDLTSADVTSANPSKKARNVGRIKHLRDRAQKLEEELPSNLIKSPLDGKELMDLFGIDPAGKGSVDRSWITDFKNALEEEVRSERIAPGDKEAAKRFVLPMASKIVPNGEIKISARDK